MGSLLGSIVGISDSLYLLLNGLAGRSWLFDTLVTLAIDNNLVKAAPLCAAFLFVWYAVGDEAAVRRRRRVLMVTVGSLFVVLAASKTMGDHIFLPRPFIQSERVYHVEGGKLVQTVPLAYRTPLAGSPQGRFERLGAGEIEENDLASFPSDHAAFFFALALGIFLASRRAGAFAIAWVLVAIAGSRMITGTHTPLDIAGGIAIGGTILLAAQFVAGRWLRGLLDRIAGWTLLYPALSAALVFLMMFEVGNSLDNLRDLARTARHIVENFVGG
ncbi:MAG TPA: phosphatase PAP2 family protein [Allosphingosinicella sp.]